MTAPDLARRLVEHHSGKWRWHPGLPLVDVGIYIAQRGEVTHWTYQADEEAPNGVGDLDWQRDFLPDIEDPLTKGWLLHLLREATGSQDACTSWTGKDWRLYGWLGASALGRFPTEGAALAAALLAVWGDHG